MNKHSNFWCITLCCPVMEKWSSSRKFVSEHYIDFKYFFFFFCFLCPSYRSPSHLFFKRFLARAVQGLKWMMKRLSRGPGSAASHTDASLVGMPRETWPPGWKVAGSLEPELQREKAHSLICLTTFYVPVFSPPHLFSLFFPLSLL